MTDFGWLNALPRRPRSPLSVPQAPGGALPVPGVEPQGPEPTQLDLDSVRQVERARLESGLQDEQRRMAASFRLSAKQNPLLMAQAQAKARQLGIDPALAIRSPQVVEAMAQQQQLDLQRLEREHPALYEQMRDIKFVQVARDDLEALQATEGALQAMGRHYRAGQMVNERGILGLKDAHGYATPEDRDRLAELDILLEEGQHDPGFLNTGAEIVGQMLGTMPIVLGAGAAAAVPALVAGPAAPFTAAGAFTAGSTAAVFTTSAGISMGNQYLDLVARGVPPETAYMASLAGGLSQGALEAMGFKIASAPFKAAIAKVAASGGAKALEHATTGAALTAFAKEVAKTWAGETGTEMAQDVTDHIWNNIALAVSGMKTDTLGDLASQMWQTFSAVGRGMVPLAIPGPFLHLMADTAHARAAQRQQKFFADFAAAAKDSKLRQNDAVGFQGSVDQMAGAHGVEDFYVDGRVLQESLHAADMSEIRAAAAAAGISEQDAAAFLPSEGKATAKFRKELPEVAAQLEAAARDGGVVAISPGEFAAHLGDTDLGRSLAPSLRYGPEGRTVGEAAQHYAGLKEQTQRLMQTAQEQADDQQAFEASLGKVKQDVLQQLAGVRKWPARDAEAAAEYFAATVANVASREGQLPDVFWQGHRAQIVGPNGTLTRGAGAGLQQEGEQVGFYSALARSVADLPMKAAPAQGWKDALKGLAGKGAVKQEEIEWTGLHEWLDMQPGKVSKDQVSEFLRGNGVQVETVTLDYSPEMSVEDLGRQLAASDANDWATWSEKIDPNETVSRESWLQMDPSERTQVAWDLFGSEYLEDARQQHKDDAQDMDSPTKFGQYQLPGGENYREVLLTLPVERTWLNGKPITEEDLSTAFGRATADRVGVLSEQSFTSPHWSQPNVLAHLRLNDRTDADGKRVLFVEEIQSDWAQKGRKEGFDDREIDGHDGKWWAQEAERLYQEGNDARKAWLSDSDKQAVYHVAVANRDALAKGIPTAPFVTKTDAWVSLALKKILLMAVEGGYDKVAFVTGEQSAERYDLSKQVDTVHAFPAKDGTWEINAVKDGSVLVVEKGLDANGVANLVGKDLAEKIVARSGERAPGAGGEEGYVYRGTDLRLGGEGMKAFYDQIVPLAAGKLLKKLGGGKMETVTMQSEWAADPGDAVPEQGEAAEQPGFTITEALRQKIAEGLPLFAPDARGEFFPRTLEILLHEKADLSTFLHETAHYWLHVFGQLASAPGASRSIVSDMQTLLDWFGVPDLETWNGMTLEQQRPHHEAFAYSFEVYLGDGRAPSKAMESLFARFQNWLRNLYGDIRGKLNAIYRSKFGKDLPILTGEVRQVMDRLVASDAEISHAEAVRDLVPRFQTQEQSGFSDEDWAAYQAAAHDSHEAAAAEVARRSLRATQWFARRKATLDRDAQKAVQRVRTDLRKQVAAEVEKSPLRALQRTLGTKGVKKLDLAAVQKLLPNASKAELGKLKRYTQADGGDVEQVAEALGFTSGEAMVRQLLEAPPMGQEIDDKVDAIMRRDHADLLDPAAREQAIESALHNELRARMVAIELQHASGGKLPWRLMQEASKEAARLQLEATPLKEIRPKQFAAAEARARREAQVHQRSNVEGSASRVTEAVRQELLQHQLARQALDASEEVRKTLRGWQKLWRADAEIAKTRDLDRVQVARAILGYYKLGALDARAQVYVDKLRELAPNLYADIEPMLQQARTGAKSFRDLTLKEFRSLESAIEALWFMAERDRLMRVGEQMARVEQAVGDSLGRLAEIGIPDTVPGDKAAMSRWQRFSRYLNNLKSLLRRVEHWAKATDGPGNEAGPFTKYIWRPVAEAINAYRLKRNAYIKRFVDLLGNLHLEPGKIDAEKELGYTFGAGSGGMGRAELLGALLHTGNLSNLRKLLLGRWAKSNLGDQDAMWDEVLPRWQGFLLRMVAEGKLTKADFDFAQGVWDLNEELKAGAQQAHHDLFGYYFKEVQAQEFTVRFPDGTSATYRGGYVPAAQDRELVREGKIHEKLDALEGDFRALMPSTGMGFTKSRVDVNRKLSLDVRKMPKHLDDVIRFTLVQPAIRDVLKIVRNDQFSGALSRVDFNAAEQMLIPWLMRAARQSTTEAGMDPGIDRFWSVVRRRTGMATMFANVSNALQQVTGLFFSALKVRGAFLRPAMWDYVKHPRDMAAAVAKQSAFMADRLTNQVFDLQEQINELTLNPGRFDKLQAWSGHHAYFLQSAFQNTVDVITWRAAYSQAIADLGAGPDVNAEAVARADAAVRQTQGSIQPEDIAKYQAGTPFNKVIAQFSGYFNMVANVNADELIGVFRDLGWKSNKARLWQIYLLGFMAPMLVSDAIAGGLAGSFDDEDDDGYGDELAAWFFGGQGKGLAALVPVFGPAAAQAVTSVASRFFGSGYQDDRMSTSPAIRALESVYGVADAAVRVVTKGEIRGQQIKDVATLLSLILGIPVSALARPASYLTDVARDKVEPYNPVDLVRGALTGRAAPGSKQH